MLFAGRNVWHSWQVVKQLLFRIATGCFRAQMLPTNRSRMLE
jgi:hypothetical protein